MGGILPHLEATTPWIQEKSKKTKRTNFGKEDRPVAEEQRRQDRRCHWGHRLLAGKFEGAAPPFDLLTV